MRIILGPPSRSLQHPTSVRAISVEHTFSEFLPPVRNPDACRGPERRILIQGNWGTCSLNRVRRLSISFEREFNVVSFVDSRNLKNSQRRAVSRPGKGNRTSSGKHWIVWSFRIFCFFPCFGLTRHLYFIAGNRSIYIGNLKFCV